MLPLNKFTVVDMNVKWMAIESFVNDDIWLVLFRVFFPTYICLTIYEESPPFYLVHITKPLQ